MQRNYVVNTKYTVKNISVPGTCIWPTNAPCHLAASSLFINAFNQSISEGYFVAKQIQTSNTSFSTTNNLHIYSKGYFVAK